MSSDSRFPIPDSRLLQARKFLGMTQKQMSEILQIGQNAYSMIENGKIKLTDRNRHILTDRLKINPIWLDTGIGDMMLDTTPRRAMVQTCNAEQHRGVPFFNKPVTGSLLISFDDMARDTPEYNIDYKPFNDCTFYRPVYGESMSPKFNSGDVVACKRVVNKELILYGETYLCMVKLDSDFYETIKVLRKHKQQPEKIILKPLNPNYDETEVPLDAIIDLYIIKGKIERNL